MNLDTIVTIGGARYQLLDYARSYRPLGPFNIADALSDFPTYGGYIARPLDAWQGRVPSTRMDPKIAPGGIRPLGQVTIRDQIESLRDGAPSQLAMMEGQGVKEAGYPLSLD